MVIIPFAFVCSRARRRANSLASEPELTKKQTLKLSGNFDRIVSAKSDWFGCRYLVLELSLLSCSDAIFCILGCECPT